MTVESNRTLCRTMFCAVLVDVVLLLVHGAAQLGVIAPFSATLSRATGWIFLACTAMPHAAWALAQITSPAQGAMPIFRSKEDGWLIVLTMTVLAAMLAGIPSRVSDTPDLAHDLSFPVALVSLLFFASRFYVLKRVATVRRAPTPS